MKNLFNKFKSEAPKGSEAVTITSTSSAVINTPVAVTVINTPGEDYEKVLVCPITRGPLRYSAETNEMISEKAGLAFPMPEGIPNINEKVARRL